MALATEKKCLQCGQGRGAVPPPRLVPERFTVDGVYQLGTYPDCITPYTGEYRTQEVYVIGFRTEHERIFRRSQKALAVTYYNSFDPPIPLWHDAAGNFCSRAMLDLLGS